MNFSTFANYDEGKALKELGSGKEGLSEKEALDRLKKYGTNKLQNHEIKWWQLLLRQFNTPFIYLLVGASLLSFFLGEFADGVVILIFIFINSILGFSNEYHSSKSLDLLKKYTVSKSRVLRGGNEAVVDSQNLVPGDIIIVNAGDIVPADIRLLETSSLSVDESILSGESLPSDKFSNSISKENIPLYQAQNILFSGATVLAGKGIGVVFATGKNSNIGMISSLALETYSESSFEKNISKFSRFILRMIVLIITILFIANAAIKGRGSNTFELLLFSIALAVSVVPEALPVVTTIALSKGAIRLAKDKVVVKRLSAVEDLGSIEVLCTDKTGTLTENKLTVSDILSDDKEKTVFYSALGNAIFKTGEESLDSFDIALFNHLNETDKKRLETYSKIDEIPFDPIRRRHTVVVRNENECMLIVRGAPEVVFNLCSALPVKDIESMRRWISEMGKDGKRVIAVAQKAVSLADCKITKHEENLVLLGLISFVDPIKSTTVETLRQAKLLGVNIKILTGDSLEVAAAVAKSVGLIKDQSEAITGEDFFIKDGSEEDLAKRAEQIKVFARMTPEQKYKIIEILQKKYEVGFLGEGINDAPALKLANVGIVVESASDLSRNAADIVLLQRSLGVIIKGIRDGRSIFENTVKYIKTTLISNFGNFYTVSVAALLIPTLPMLPGQILLLNLLSDFPMIAISTDRVNEAQLRRPRSYQVREILFISIILGLVSSIFDFFFFIAFNHPGQPKMLQTHWFIGSALTELALIFSIRTRLPFWQGRGPTASLFGLSILAGLTAIIIPFTSFGQRVFGFMRPELKSLGIIAIIVTAYFIVTEILKVFYYRRELNVDPVYINKKLQ